MKTAVSPMPPAVKTGLSGGRSPLYFQIAQVLRDMIVSGELRESARLPTEEELCAQHAVSRSTVRQAMNELLLQHLVVRRRGLGTFVAPRGRAQRVTHPVGSIYHALNYVENVRYRKLSRGEAVPPESIRALLALDAGEKCMCIVEAGKANGLPLTRAEMYFPTDFGRRLTSADFASGTPIVRLIERHLGLKAERAEQIVEPVAADAQTATVLGLAAGTPLLRITRVYFLSDGRAFGTSVTCYHPDRYTLHIDLVERPPA